MNAQTDLGVYLAYYELREVLNCDPQIVRDGREE